MPSISEQGTVKQRENEFLTEVTMSEEQIPVEDMLAVKTVALKPSGIRKFFDIVSEMKDAISLGVGEPDFDTPWHIRDEGIYSLEKGRTFYTSNSGLKELREAIAQKLERDQGLSYDPMKEILITVGGSEAIDLMFRAMINPGDEILIPQPSYVSYEPCAVLADAKPVIIGLTEENKFRLTPEALEKAVTPKSKILVLPYPNNPTGAIMTREDLRAIAPVIREHNLYVLSDEIYGALTYVNEGKHTSIAEIPGMKERTVLVNGFSKAYAMTGWRLGYACGPRAIIRQMTKIHQYAIMCAPTTSQYAAVEAIKNGDEDVERMRISYDQRRRFVLEMLKEMNLPCFEPEGAFYVFPCIREFGMTSEEFATKLLTEKKVAIVPGTAFGDCGEGYLRISYAYSIDDLREALLRLKDFVEEIRKNS
jgi:aminotransferase